jgi:hypothetical protein
MVPTGLSTLPGPAPQLERDFTLYLKLLRVSRTPLFHQRSPCLTTTGCARHLRQLPATLRTTLRLLWGESGNLLGNSLLVQHKPTSDTVTPAAGKGILLVEIRQGLPTCGTLYFTNATHSLRQSMELDDGAISLFVNSELGFSFKFHICVLHFCLAWKSGKFNFAVFRLSDDAFCYVSNTPWWLLETLKKLLYHQVWTVEGTTAVSSIRTLQSVLSSSSLRICAIFETAKDIESIHWHQHLTITWWRCLGQFET